MVIKAYPGSFDPPHRGHLDIAERAAATCDQLIVAIGKNPSKAGMLPVEKRIQLLRHALWHIKNVVVDSYDGLLVDYLYEKGIYTNVRGIRDDKDHSFEKTQEYYNLWLNPEITTEYIQCKDAYYHLSSSAVKDLIARWGNISKTDHLLPVAVKKATEEALNNQFLLGITGVPGSGKSYVMQQFTHYCEELGIPHYALQMDKLRHQIAFSNDPQFFQGLRNQVAEAFPMSLEQDGSLSVDALRATFLGNKPKMQELEKMTKNALMSLMRSTLWQKQGAIFIESALFAEHPHLLPVVNNDMLVVDVDQQTQYQRIAQRNAFYDSKEKIDGLVGMQFPTSTKVATIQEAIALDAYGALQILENREIGDEHIYQWFLKSMSQIDPLGKLYFQGLRKRWGYSWDWKVAFRMLIQQWQPTTEVYHPSIKNLDTCEGLLHLATACNTQDQLTSWYTTYGQPKVQAQA
jgi:pantetheine-phosphate adenylyltransferase